MMRNNLTQHIIFCPPPWFVHDEGKRVCVCVCWGTGTGLCAWLPLHDTAVAWAHYWTTFLSVNKTKASPVSHSTQMLTHMGSIRALVCVCVCVQWMLSVCKSVDSRRMGASHLIVFMRTYKRRAYTALMQPVCDGIVWAHEYWNTTFTPLRKNNT